MCCVVWPRASQKAPFDSLSLALSLEPRLAGQTVCGNILLGAQPPWSGLWKPERPSPPDEIMLYCYCGEGCLSGTETKGMVEGKLTFILLPLCTLFPLQKEVFSLSLLFPPSQFNLLYWHDVTLPPHFVTLQPYLKWIKKLRIFNSIYTQYPIMTKQKQFADVL